MIQHKKTCFLIKFTTVIHFIPIKSKNLRADMEILFLMQLRINFFMTIKYFCGYTKV